MSVNYTPTPIAAGSIPSATALNNNGATPWAGIQAAWTAYTPAWTGTTDPVLNDGTISGAYLQVGKTITFRITITMGAGTTYGTGQWKLAPPVTPSAGSNYQRFAGTAFDSSAPAYYPASAMWLTASSALVLWTDPTTAGNNNRSVTSAVPFTWATGDVLAITGTYEAA